MTRFEKKKPEGTWQTKGKRKMNLPRVFSTGRRWGITSSRSNFWGWSHSLSCGQSLLKQILRKDAHPGQHYPGFSRKIILRGRSA